MGRLSEYSDDELSALFPARKPEDRKPEPVTPLPGWTEEGVGRMLRDVYGLDEGGGEGGEGVSERGEPVMADVALALFGFTVGMLAAYNGNPVAALICGAFMWAAARRLWWRWKARQ